MTFLGHARRDAGGRPGDSESGLIVERDDGHSFLLTVGDGCGRLRNGGRVTLRELRETEGSRALLEHEESGISCDVLGTQAVTIVDEASAAAGHADDADVAPELARVVTALQTALAILGYDPGAPDGDVGTATAAALMQYRSDKRHDVTGRDLRFSLWTLGMDVLVERPRDQEALAIADTLFGIANR